MYAHTLSSPGGGGAAAPMLVVLEARRRDLEPTGSAAAEFALYTHNGEPEPPPSRSLARRRRAVVVDRTRFVVRHERKRPVSEGKADGQRERETVDTEFSMELQTSHDDQKSQNPVKLIVFNYVLWKLKIINTWMSMISVYQT